jgi:hypothetical protein
MSDAEAGPSRILEQERPPLVASQTLSLACRISTDKRACIA